jgi:hypothetical protein
MLLLFQVSGSAAGMQETMMTKTPLDEFLAECLARDPDYDGLGVDELYGPYLSWCGLRDLSLSGERRSGRPCALLVSVRRAGAACARAWR